MAPPLGLLQQPPASGKRVRIRKTTSRERAKRETFAVQSGETERVDDLDKSTLDRA